VTRTALTYRTEDSFLHKCGIIPKISLVVAFLIALIRFNDPVFSVALLLVSFAVMRLAKIPLTELWQKGGLKYIIFLTTFSMFAFLVGFSRPDMLHNIIVAHRYPDELMFRDIIPPFTIWIMEFHYTIGGVMLVITNMCRVLIGFFVLQTFMYSTRLIDMISLSSKLRFPTQLLMMSVIIYNFFPLTQKYAIENMEAQSCRGFKYRGRNPWKRFMQITKVGLMPLVTYATFTLSDQLLLATQARGFGTGKFANLIDYKKYSVRDYVLLAAMIALAAGSVILTSVYKIGIL